MSLDRAKADLERWQAEVSRLREILAHAEGEVQKHLAAVEVLTRYQAAEAQDQARETQSAQPPPQATVAPKSPALNKESPYYGKSLAEAATTAVALTGEPLTVAGIAHILRKAGWNFTSPHPTNGLYWALRSHSLKTGAIITVPGNRWALASWKPDDDHLAKTRAGLAAARTRGVRLGPPPRITPEVDAKLRAMLTGGMRVSQAARELGISSQAIYNWRKRQTEQQADLQTPMPDTSPTGRPN